jgi:hypothetical protein
MSEYTPFAGLLRLEPGEPILTDDGRFVSSNIDIIDRLLQVGAKTHRHDGHAATPDPVTAATLSTLDTGGTIPAETPLYVGYTWLDADGGETKISPVAQITTQDALQTPEIAPTWNGVVDHAAGTLMAETYYYAVTVIDGLGAETMLSPSVTVTVPPGNAVNRVTIAGLDTIVTSVGGTGWRLWRAVGGGEWDLLTTGAGASYVDDGSATPNCNVDPPSSPAQTNNTNVLRVTVPNGPPPATATQFRTYVSTSGDFTDPSLLGTYPIADVGVQKSYTSLTLLPGAPPPVSLSIAGADQIDAETMLDNLHWLAPVANAAALPAAGNSDGDARVTLNDRKIHVWSTAAANWLAIGGGGGYDVTARLTPPLPPTSAQSIPNSTVATVQWGIAEYEVPGTIWDIATPGDIVIPEAGTYSLMAQVYLLLGGVSECWLQIVLEAGATDRYLAYDRVLDPGATAPNIMRVGTKFKLAASAVLRLEIVNGSGAAVEVSNQQDDSWFTLAKVAIG